MVDNFHQNRKMACVLARQMVTPEHVNAVELSRLGRSGRILFRTARLRDQGVEEREIFTPEEIHTLFEAPKGSATSATRSASCLTAGTPRTSDGS